MAINHVPYPWLLERQPGKTRQASSFGRDPERGGTWFGFRPKVALIKRILLAPGETHVMAEPSGPGVVTRIFMTTLMPFNNHALRDAVLKFYWDGESDPSVVSPLGDFFGAPFGKYKLYISEPMSLTAGAFNFRLPMPFAEGARLEVTNEGRRVIEPLFYHITYYELDQPLQSDLRFHAQWRRENPTHKGKPYTILQAQGDGHYVGCHMSMQNLEWWLKPPVKYIPFPYGFGIGMLEGWEEITVDGEQQPSIHGTGTEDYFNGAWYYKDDPEFYAPYHGCTVKDYLRGRIATYRFDLHAPVPFQQDIRVQIGHGFYNRLRCDYSSTAYWYQREPHHPLPPLPSPQDRRRSSALINLLQVGLAVGAPVIGGLALAAGLINRSQKE